MDIYSVANPLVFEHLYLDPGTGSFILQVLIAAFIGGVFAVRTQWSRIKKLLNKKKAESDLPSEEQKNKLDE